jgi:hypothetical protein
MNEIYLYVLVRPEHESPEEASFEVFCTYENPVPEMNPDDFSHRFTWNDAQVNRQLPGLLRGAAKTRRRPHSPLEQLAQAMAQGVARGAEGLKHLLRGEGPADERRRIGEFLYHQLFLKAAGEKLDKAIADARDPSVEGDEVKLRLILDSPYLSIVPWECMYYPRQDEYLALVSEVALARFQPSQVNWRRHAVALPLRVLLVDSRSDWQATEYDLKLVLKHLEPYGDKLVVDLIRHPTMDSLRERLIGGEFHVVHFFAHVESEASGPYLVLPDEQGEGWYRGYFMQELRHLFAHSVRLLVLTPFEDMGRTWLGNLIGARAEEIGVPAVVTTQIELSGSQLADFAQAFYPALAEGQPVDRAAAAAQSALAHKGKGPVGAVALFLSTRDADAAVFDLVDETTPSAKDVAGVPSRDSVIDVIRQAVSVTGGSAVIGAEIDQLGDSDELDGYLEEEAEDEVNDAASVQQL